MSTLPSHLQHVFAATADRYRGTSITAREFARGKLRRDPVCRAMLNGLLPAGGTLVDVGCGQGVMLAAIADARRAGASGRWPVNASPAPSCERMIGIEIRGRVARLAAQALGDEASIVVGDARRIEIPPARAILMFDILRMMSSADQEALLKHAVHSLEPHGALIVREVDAGAGWGFQAVRFGNRLKALCTGDWRTRFHFRTAAEWRAVFERLGLAVESRPMGEGTPFANVLFRTIKQL